LPCSAALKAKLNPATPAPMTKKSLVFILNGTEL
jgi:hypothetical protein